jgi:hypothetical protein
VVAVIIATNATQEVRVLAARLYLTPVREVRDRERGETRFARVTTPLLRRPASDERGGAVAADLVAYGAEHRSPHRAEAPRSHDNERKLRQVRGL